MDLIQLLKSLQRYTDLVNFQYYDISRKPCLAICRDGLEKVSIKQPLLNGDSAFTVPTETMPKPFGPHFLTKKREQRLP